jgi:hypothetical protein
MHPQLAEIHSELERAQFRLDRLSTTTPDDHWSTRRDKKRWSIAECVAHLNLTSEAMIPRLREAIEKAPPRRRTKRDKFKLGFSGRMIARGVGELRRLAGFRFGALRTKPAFIPRGNLDRDELLANFERMQMELMELVEDAEGRAIDRMRVISPFDAKHSYNAYAGLVIVVRHQHRHIQQAEQVWEYGNIHMHIGGPAAQRAGKRS